VDTTGVSGAIVVEEPACWFCGSKRADVHAHKIPRARGGSRQSPSNLLPSCQGCARTKGWMTIGEFREITRRTLVAQRQISENIEFRFAGEGGNPWRVKADPNLIGPGRPRKPVEPTVACWCGRQIPSSKLAKHLANCRTPT
jgi:hypothetical protein